MYIYSISETEGIRLEGFEEISQPYIRRLAEIHPSNIYFFAERGSA